MIMTNSPATFQTMMNHIFHPIIAKHKLLGTSIRVYMDEIAITTQTTDQDHTVAVRDVLAVATEHDLYFKLDKCLVHVPSIDYLRVILEKGVVTDTVFYRLLPLVSCDCEILHMT